MTVQFAISHGSPQVKKQKADAFAVKLAPIINEYRMKGLSLLKIAGALNADGILTARGKANTRTTQGIKNVLQRVKASE